MEVEAHGHHDWHEDCEERERFLSHAKGASTQSEKDHQDRDDENVFTLELLDDTRHAARNRTRRSDDLERTSHNQDERNNLHGLLDTDRRASKTSKTP